MTNQPNDDTPAPKKRGPRSDRGVPRVDDGKRLKRRTVRMDDARWEHCEANGDASKYIRGLIDNDRKERQ